MTLQWSTLYYSFHFDIIWCPIFKLVFSNSHPIFFSNRDHLIYIDVVLHNAIGTRWSALRMSYPSNLGCKLDYALPASLKEDTLIGLICLSNHLHELFCLQLQYQCIWRSSSCYTIVDQCFINQITIKKYNYSLS